MWERVNLLQKVLKIASRLWASSIKFDGPFPNLGGFLELSGIFLHHFVMYPQIKIKTKGLYSTLYLVTRNCAVSCPVSLI
jgi:hypothetical protein